mmetsp:Transcript_16351/g.39199  ORF Transcript_16351/g.39199 Transcript_16351/m.39199 type:complete len:288 (-) Transcript_16351:1674-2537(-)
MSPRLSASSADVSPDANPLACVTATAPLVVSSPGPTTSHLKLDPGSTGSVQSTRRPFCASTRTAPELSVAASSPLQTMSTLATGSSASARETDADAKRSPLDTVTPRTMLGAAPRSSALRSRLAVLAVPNEATACVALRRHCRPLGSAHVHSYASPSPHPAISPVAASSTHASGSADADASTMSAASRRNTVRSPPATRAESGDLWMESESEARAAAPAEVPSRRTSYLAPPARVFLGMWSTAPWLSRTTAWSAWLVTVQAYSSGASLVAHDENSAVDVRYMSLPRT